MRSLAEPRVAAAGLNVRMLDTPGEVLPLPMHSVDSVVVTYTLCTIPDVVAALAELQRVLRPPARCCSASMALRLIRRSGACRIVWTVSGAAWRAAAT
jgi:ubiquinone/menaquinone biosynthesis C-methylase UbiE